MTATSRSQGGRRLLAAGAALSLGVFGVLAAGTAAHAENIDLSETGSITVHKHENPGTGAANPDGSGTLPTTPGIADVVFEYCTISDIDLFDGTNTGWDEVNAITAAQLEAAAATGVTTLGPHTLTGCTAMPGTDADGLSTTGDLPLGAYFVREISAPPQVTETAAPFIVTIPTPTNNEAPLDGTWVYDVNVYPKNTVATPPRKNIVEQTDNGAVLGAPIHYEVTTRVPGLPAGQTYNKFVVTDTLDTRLDPQEATPVTVEIFGGAAMTLGTDFTATWAGQSLTVTLLAPGLAQLEPGQNIVVGFHAIALEIGSIDNQAVVNINDMDLGGEDGPGDTPTNIVQTRWGAAELLKVNAADETDRLGGAVFNVYMSTMDTAGCVAQMPGLTQVTSAGAPYTVTSAADGSISIPGLWVGDTELQVAADGTVTNVGVAEHDYQARCYVLEEVTAPAGFVLPTGAAAYTEIVITPGAVTTPEDEWITIENTQQGVPELPLTGAAGQIMLTVGGIALIAVATGVVLVTRRRAKTEA